jgi:hypothetical protein
MKKKTISFPEDDMSHDMRPHYDVDYRKSRPNRFAGRPKMVIGASRGGAREGAGRKPSPEPLVAKRVYLYPHHVKLLHKIDKNLSAAIRKLVDTRK